MNRQYIGARYIPIPYNNPNGGYGWLPGVAYEGMTIVTYNNRSYISKRNVPAISTPPDEDPEHWVPAYLYNADVSEALLQIEELQEEKANKDGVYPDLWAGQLISDEMRTDNQPYLTRETADGLTGISGICYPVLVGASVTENQLIRYPTSGTTYGGVTLTVNNNVIELSGTASASWINCFGSHTTKANHVYLIVTTKIADPNNTNIRIGSLNSYINTTIGTSKMFKPSGSVYDGLGLESYGGSGTDLSGIKFSANIIDLTRKFGSAIADYAYTLEQATAGSGIAWLRSYGFLGGYVPYNTGTIESVEATAKVVRDENGENAVTYLLGSDVLRGIFKLDSSNNLYADGDRKTADGTITRYYGTRAYQSGDESLADAITDGTTTVYKLSTPTTEISTPFTSPQLVYPDGTEEYVTENGLPVGHETSYPYDLKGLVEGLIDVPDVPDVPGTYTLKATRTAAGLSYSWIAD